MTRGLSAALLCGLIAGVVPTAGAESPPADPSRADPAGADPWQVLTELRDELRAQSPLRTNFTQTFVPGGFSTGDQESGVLYVGLPRCLRFEYREPFPKNFLLCGDWVYTWNPDEPSGRRFLIDDSEAEGLDLLRLEVDALKKRYRAELDPSEAGRTVVRLTPLDEAAEIREASVEVASEEPESERIGSGEVRGLLALAYVDRSGNRTRFAITDYRRLTSEDVFKTPPIQWLED